MGNLKGVWSGVCRSIAESQRLLSSFVRPYARSPLPPHKEKCRSSPSIETYLRVRLDSKESTMTGGEDCESRSFVTVSVSGHSCGSEARNSKTTPRAAQQSSPPAKSTTPAAGGATLHSGRRVSAGRTKAINWALPSFAKRGLYLVPLKVAPGSLRVYIIVNV
jgi:hypothetical protein